MVRENWIKKHSWTKNVKLDCGIVVGHFDERPKILKESHRNFTP